MRKKKKSMEKKGKKAGRMEIGEEESKAKRVQEKSKADTQADKKQEREIPA